MDVFVKCPHPSGIVVGRVSEKGAKDAQKAADDGHDNDGDDDDDEDFSSLKELP